MSTEHVSIPSSAAPAAGQPVDATGASAAPVERRKLKFDQRYVAPLFITLILIMAHVSYGVLVSPWKTFLAIGTAILVEIIAGRMVYGKIPNLASAYITGISVGILLRSDAAFWPYAFCSAISILSKYVIRVKDRHIWNPSNFGICITLIVAHNAVHTLGKEWGNSLWAMIVIWTLGSIIIGRLKRFHICATYVASFFFFALLRHWLGGYPLEAAIGPITGPMYQLFIFFMITDPKTTVQSRKGQILVAFLVAAMEAILRTFFRDIHAPYYALFIVGPIANLIEIWWKSRGRQT
jgi:enediyne biosynthesis protein E5